MQNFNSTSQFLSKTRQSDGTIDLNQLKQIPGGGTHDIYKINSDETPSFLLKVMRNTIDKEESVLAPQLTKLTEQYKTLYDIFGSDRCLIENRSIENLIINSEPTSKKAIVSVVPFDTCFKSEEKFGFNAEPLEMDEVIIKKNPELYREMNLALMGSVGSSASFNINDYLIFHQEFAAIFTKLEKEKDLQKVMQEFLIKFQKFYKQTGILMDLIGYDNVLFYKNNEGWQFKLGSVIKHDTRSLTIDTLAEIAHTPSVVKDFEKSTAIFYMPACIRLLNVIAEKLNINRIVADVTLTTEDINHLSTIHEQLKFGTRAVTYAKHNDFETALHYFYLYVESDEEHNTYVSDMLGTRYWQFIKDSNIERSIEEIKVFLAILRDEKNHFPKERLDLINAAIQGLQTKLDCLDQSANPYSQETISLLLAKKGFFRIDPPTKLQESLLKGFTNIDSSLTESQASILKGFRN